MHDVFVVTSEGSGGGHVTRIVYAADEDDAPQTHQDNHSRRVDRGRGHPNYPADVDREVDRVECRTADGLVTQRGLTLARHLGQGTDAEIGGPQALHRLSGPDLRGTGHSTLAADRGGSTGTGSGSSSKFKSKGKHK